MSKLITLRGRTSKLLRFFVQDTSSSVLAGLTGLTSASAGLIAYYIREGDASPTAIALSAGVVGTWSSGGFAEVDSTHMPGVYELGVPNAALASGSSVTFYLSGAVNMAPTPAEIDLVAFDPQDATHLGLSALPNAAAGSVGGLDTPVAQAGTAQAGGANTITLAAGASATDNYYRGSTVEIVSGTGAGQARIIAGYVGATKVATVGRNWAVQPDNTSVYAVRSDVEALVNDSLQVTVGTNNDKTGYALTAGEHTSIQSDVQTGMTAQHYTQARGDKLDDLDATISSRLASSAYTAPDNADIATILTDVASILGTVNLNLDAKVSSRLASLGYTAPDNAGIAAILVDAAAILANTDVATSTRQPAGNVTVGAYAAGEDPASLVLATPANKLATDASGEVAVGSVAAGALTAIAGALWGALTSAYAAAGSFGKLLGGFTFNGSSVNAYATNVIAPPSSVAVIVSQLTVSAVGSNAPSILNLQVSRNGDFTLTATMLDANGNPVDITGGAAQMLVKNDEGDDDSAAILVLDSHNVGGIAFTNPRAGVFQVAISPTSVSNKTTFPDREYKVYGIKVWEAAGRQTNLMEGTFQVVPFPVANVVVP